MMIGHTEPSAYAIQMANHRDAMRHARLIAGAVIDDRFRRGGYEPMTSQSVRALVRGLVAEFLASMPRPAETQLNHEPMLADGPAVSLPNGWGPISNADPLADPHLIKGA